MDKTAYFKLLQILSFLQLPLSIGCIYLSVSIAVDYFHITSMQYVELFLLALGVYLLVGIPFSLFSTFISSKIWKPLVSFKKIYFKAMLTTLIQSTFVALFLPAFFALYPFIKDLLLTFALIMIGSVSVAFFSAGWYLKNIFFYGTKIKRRPDLEKKVLEPIGMRGKIKILHVTQTSFDTINAMLLLFSNEIILVNGIDKKLSQKELEAVVIHEIGHAKSKVKILLLSIPFLLLVIGGGYYLMVQKIGLEVILAAMLAVMFIELISFSRLRLQEKWADNFAKTKVGKKVYGQALQKIHSYNHIPEKTMLLISSHPHLKDRAK